jgi:iron complex transport system substrate-binding protein
VRRIISFLPSATEMVYALGLEDQLYGVTHECDHPEGVRSKPVVVRTILPVEEMSQREIDLAVTARLRDGLSLYRADEMMIREIGPDLILTQELCQVCAPSGNEVTQLLASLSSKPEVIYLTPRSLGGIFDNLLQIAEAAGRMDRAQTLIDETRARLERVAARTAAAKQRPRVFCMEWFDPLYCSGHWVPEMVALAGGDDLLGRPGAESVRIRWEDVVAGAPDVLILSPCGFGLARSVEHAVLLAAYPGWADLPAARNGRVYAVDANSYFARPGPRVVDGTELLAHLIHPELFAWSGSTDAFCRLSIGDIATSAAASGSRHGAVAR